MMNPDMNKRITPEEYDLCASKFISEYGYIGAPVRETVAAYLDGAPFDRQSAVWQHHNNTFEKNTVDAGIRKHYADPESITLDEYFLYSGLTQGLMYGYSLESFRSKPDCHGGLFWMYADCWGEVGWTIVDSYARRKPSWYFVRRALAPARLILRRSGGKVVVTMANDTREAIKGRLEYGWMALDGADRQLDTQPFTCLPLSRTVVAEFGAGKGDPTRQVWLARVRRRDDILPATLRAADVRHLKLARPKLTLSVERAAAGQWAARVGSDVYAHAVHLILPDGATPEDDYFDLLPGETREVRVASRGKLSEKNVALTSVVPTTSTSTST
jgi:beta-mannosidase